MYSASTAFHNAVTANNVVTRLLMQFSDGTFLTGEDVKNINITYPMNEETELIMGKCVSSELSTDILNYDALLNDFSYGECKLSLGVQLTTDTWSKPAGNATVVSDYGSSQAVTITARAQAPYILVNNTASTVQPTFAPTCLVLLNNILYVGDGVHLWAATLNGTTLTTKSIDNDIIANKLSRWKYRGLCYQNSKSYEFGADGVKTFEFVPLGTYFINKPEKRKASVVQCTALDAMQQFNVNVDDWWAGLKWPLTRSQLLVSLCNHVNVTLKSSTFLGSSISIASAPMAGNGLIGSDVLGWIAESACSYARMSRDNKLELVWFSTQSITVQHSFGDAPAEYETPAVDVLHIMVAANDLGVVIPEAGGTNEYQILDNPLLYGDTETAIRAKAQGIYERLAAFAVYTPNEITAPGDWAVEPGDIIQVVNSDGITRTLPIFRYTLSWAGGYAKNTYSCTGGTGREPLDKASRKEFAAYRAYHKLEVDIQGIRSEIGDIEGNVNNLEVTASELKVQIAGKIDGTEASSMIDQKVNSISLSVSSGENGSTFEIKSGGITLSTQTLDLNVNAANINGTLTASQIDATNLHVNGANIDNLTVSNAQIDTLSAKKIIGGDATNGFISSGALSSKTTPVDLLYLNDMDCELGFIGTLKLGRRDSTASTELTEFKLKTPKGERTWDDIVTGTSQGVVAVFG